MRVLITGTPGTGKSTIARFLSKSLGFECLSITDFVKERKLGSGYSQKLKTWEVEEGRLKKELESYIRNKPNIIIEGHLSHIVSPRISGLCIVLRTGNPELFRRLKQRKYPKAKIEENIQAEIFNVCHDEAKAKGHRVLAIDATTFSNFEKSLLKDFIYKLSLQ
jgi:adenylate kinase